MQLLAGSIQIGDLDGIRRILDRRPELANGRLVEHLADRTALHVVADWPGFFPRGPEVVHLLVSYGADPNPPRENPGNENPLASSDDVGVLWHAAGLGLVDRIDELVASDPPSERALGQAFWHACAGAHRRAAERLLDLGADRDWVLLPDWDQTPLDTARRSGTARDLLITWLEQIGARSGAHRDG